MNILSTIAGLVGGAVNAPMGLLVGTLQSGFKAAIQFHKEGIAFARDVGLSAKEAQAYTDVLIKRTQVLANQYGVSAEAILQIQRNISEATGKQLMLNDAQNEGFVQINKLVGSQATTKFTEEIVNGMGGQIDTVQGAIAKVYATATKQGLNAKKLTDKVAQNLSMANRLSFRNGIEGITRMAALSEKVGLNMASVESAAKSFMDLDKAIENAAHMQMLGGSAAAMFGNPLTASYEANYDPEAFAKRMSDSLASYATFDKSKGIANVNGMNMDFVRQIAKAMGISEEDAVKNAKKQAEVRYKETALGGTLDRVAMGNEAKRNYILNNAQVTNNGRDLEINGKNINNISEKEWADMMHFDGMSDKEILEEQAKTLISVDEHITGAAATVTASVANGIEPELKKIGVEIQNLGNFLSKYAEQWGADTGQAVGRAMHWLNANGDKIATVASGILGGITKLFHFFSTHWKTLIAAIVAWKVGKGVLGGSLGGGGGTSLGAKAANGSRTLTKLGNIGKNVWTKLGPNASKAVKIGGGVVGGAIAIAQGASALTNYKTAQKDLNKALARGEINQETYNEQLDQARIEKNKAVGGAVGSGIGAALGSFFGPLGTAAGGVLGNWIGEKVGESWDTITEVASDAWEGTKKLARNVWDASKNFARGAWDASKNFARGAWDVAKNVGSEVWNAISNIASSFWGGVTKVASDAWDGVTTVANDVWNGIRNYASGIWDGIGNIASGVWNSIETVGKTALDGISNIADKVSNAITKGYEGAKSVISDFYGGGKTAVKDVYEGVKTVVGDIGGAIKGLFSSKNEKEEITSITNLYTNTTNVINGEKHAEGGIVGGNSYAGDKVLTRLNSGEMVLNTDQQAALFNFINKIPNILGNVQTVNSNAYSNVTSYRAVNNPLSNIINSSLVNMMSRLLTNNNDNSNTSNVTSYRANYNSDTFTQRIYSSLLANNNSISKPNNVSNMMTSMVSSILTNQNDVRTKPVGDKEYIYVPKNSETSNVNGNKISVNDFNINLSGTIKLDGGNNSKNVDVNALLNDFSFMNALKEMIKTSINNDMNGGRYMNDLATMRGHISSMSSFGR